MDTNTILITILIFVLLLAAIFFIPRWLIKRAIRQVIKIFRENNATDQKNAKTADELGLTPPGILERMMRRRDYKPYALDALMRAEIIQQTEDGRLYLSEEKLSAFGLEKGALHYR